ncbi:MAG: hypothetical protein LC641_10855 [Spirochaeta sp.]|nr:hypothetical protein [Spirochaeta sp.]
MSLWLRVLLIAANWVLFHIGSGFATHHMPARFFDHESPLFKTRAFEAEGRLYRRVLRIHRWKDLLPEAGATFAGGFAKRSLFPEHRTDQAYLQRFIAETRRAELTHWLPIALSATFFLWNPPEIASWMPVYAAATNLPFILVQRANRPRLQRLAKTGQFRRTEAS